MSTESTSFAKKSAEKPSSLAREYFVFLRSTGKWWMLPLLVLLLVGGALMVLGSTSAAPFIYAIF